MAHSASLGAYGSAEGVCWELVSYLREFERVQGAPGLPRIRRTSAVGSTL